MTYEQDLAKAMADLKRWQRKMALARTKLRRIKARVKRLQKHVQAGRQKLPRSPPHKKLSLSLPVVNPRNIPEI